MTDNSTPNKWLGSGILIAVGPVIAYAISFAFESGYAEYFGYPTHLIETNLTNVFTGFVALIGGVGILWMPLEFLHSLWNPIPNVLKSSLRKFIGFLIVVIALALKFRSWKYWVPIGMAFVVLFLIEFILPIFTARPKTSYLAKLAFENARDLEYDTLMDKFVRTIGVPLFLAFIFGVGSSYLASAYGHFKARAQTEFFVVSEPEGEMVLLRAYGDKWILSQFDRENNKLLEGRTLMLTNDMDGKSIRKESLGFMKLDTPQAVDTSTDAARVQPGDSTGADK